MEDDDLQAYIQQIQVNNNEDEFEAGLLVQPEDLAEAKRIALYDVIFNENTKIKSSTVVYCF